MMECEACGHLPHSGRCPGYANCGCGQGQPAEMKMTRTTFYVRVDFDAPIPIPRDVFERVLEHGTASEAIDEGVWGWMPLGDEFAEAIDAGESLLDTRLTVMEEGWTHE